MTEALTPQVVSDADEVAEDAMQLIAISNFNGICRLVAALSANGHLTPGQLDNIHDAMTTPLDDPDWRDYSFISDTRETLEIVLGQAMKDARAQWRLEIDPD